MTKPILIISLLLISAQTIALISCPTCSKGYVVSSLEEALVTHSNTKNQISQKAPQGYSFLLEKAKSINPEETPVKTIINKQTEMAKRTEYLNKESEIRRMNEYATRRNLELLSQSMYKKNKEDFEQDVKGQIRARK